MKPIVAIGIVAVMGFALYNESQKKSSLTFTTGIAKTIFEPNFRL